MNTVPAISRDDFDRTKNPFFRISVGKAPHLEDSASFTRRLEDRSESLRDLAVELWEMSTTTGRAPGIRDMLEDKWEHFAAYSLVIDVSGDADGVSLPKLKPDQIGEKLQDMFSDNAKVAELSGLMRPALFDALQTNRPASFECSLNAQGENARELQGAVLPFGYAKLRSLLIVIEESAESDDTGGEYVLNLDESAILSDVNEKNDHSDVVEHDEIIERAKPARGAKDRSMPSVVDLISEARVSAEDAQKAEEKSRMALYAALSRSYDLALCAAKTPEAFAAQLIFGSDCSEGKLASYTAVLAEALSQDIPQGELGNFLKGLDGGIETLIEANRRKK